MRSLRIDPEKACELLVIAIISFSVCELQDH